MQAMLLWNAWSVVFVYFEYYNNEIQPKIILKNI